MVQELIPRVCPLGMRHKELEQVEFGWSHLNGLVSHEYSPTIHVEQKILDLEAVSLLTCSYAAAAYHAQSIREVQRALLRNRQRRRPSPE